MSRPQCHVSGAMALVLHVSRLAGIAPIQFRLRHDGWLMRVSPFMYVYNVILFSIVVSVGVTGLILDLNVEPSRAVRMRTPTKRILWIADFGIVLLTAIVGAYEGPLRMNKMMRYLNELRKINTIMNSQTSASTVRTHMAAISFIMLGYLLVTLLDIWTIMVDVIRYDRDRFIACLYMSFGYAYMGMIFLQCQFIVGALAVYSTLKNLNDALETETVIQGSTVGYNDHITLKRNNRIYPMNVKNVNYISYSDYLITRPHKKVHETVRQLALSFSNICCLVSSVTKCHEIVLVLLIATFAVHLVIIPYYISLALQYTESQVEAVLLLLLWYSTHFVSLVLLVEPCHWTLEEVNRTHVLVSLLTHHASNADSLLAAELDEFFKHLTLNKIAFSPLGVCTLARPLGATILGILTTYLVIIFQFQTSADKADGF